MDIYGLFVRNNENRLLNNTQITWVVFTKYKNEYLSQE